MKKTLLLFVLTLLSTLTSSAYDALVDGIYYNFDISTRTAEVTYYVYASESNSSAYTGSVTIPETVTYEGVTYSVTLIGNSAFYKCRSLTSVTIPNSVIEIGNSAFHKCTSLTSIKIPSTVTSIGNLAFDDCNSLTSIAIPSSVISIGSSAFSGCSGLTSISVATGNTVYNSQNKIKGNAIIETASNTLIAGCKYTNIPNGVTAIGDYAFSGSGLTKISIPNSVTSIGNQAFYRCSSLTSITIPNSVTSIGNQAFYRCEGMTSVTIGNGVTAIGPSTFSNCSLLTSVTIGNSVTSIGSNAFYNCSSLKDVYCHAEQVPNTDYSAFSKVPLTSATLNVPEASIKSYKDTEPWSGFGIITRTGILIDGLLFHLDTNTNQATVTYGDINYSGKVTIPETVTYGGVTYSVTEIGEKCFYQCSNLTSVTIPNSVVSIGEWAFYKCSGLTEVTIPSSVTTIETSAFNNCSALTSIEIPNSVTTIGNSAFYNCSGLTEVTIGNGVTTIGNDAFEYCKNLTEVTIPNSVTSIGYSAFYGCSGLTSVTIPNSVTSIGNQAFYNTAWYSNQSEGLIYAGRVAYLYKGTMPENTSIAIKEGTLGISPYAFSECKNLTSITIPNSVTSIGNGAFLGCSGLTSMAIPNNVTEIGSYTFQNCSGLTSLTMGNSVISIGQYAFNKCSSLTSVEIPTSVISIGFYAFYDCSSLANVAIPNSVTSIGEGAFYNTAWYDNQPDGLIYAGKVAYKYKGTMPEDTSISIKEETISITSSAFYGCSGLTSVYIPNSVTSIGKNAFYNCSALTSIEIPNSVTNIGGYAFYGCFGLTSVTIPNSVTNIGGYAFFECSKLTDLYCYAEIVPETYSTTFRDLYIGKATLHVPEASIASYKATKPWNGFGSIVALEPLPKCATPTIAFADGELQFSCETEGVEYVYNVTPPSAKTGSGSKVSLSTTYKVTVYATKNGYENSDTATKEIDLGTTSIRGDVNNDGTVSMPDAMFIVQKMLKGKFPDEE